MLMPSFCCVAQDFSGFGVGGGFAQRIGGADLGVLLTQPTDFTAQFQYLVRAFLRTASSVASAASAFVARSRSRCRSCA